MEKKLWTFGCSFTEDSNNFQHEAPYWKDYLEYKKVKHIPVWSTVLSNLLDMEDKNFGYGGVGNDYIFEKFLEVSPNLLEGDYVIIQWSSFNRIQFPFNHGNEFKFNSIHISNIIAGQSYKDSFPKNVERGIKYLAYVNDSKVKIDEFHERIEFLIHYCRNRKINLFFWCMDLENLHLVEVVKKYSNYFYNVHGDFNLRDKMISYNDHLLLKTTIDHDTNGKVVDYHPSEQGHRLIATFLFEFINSQKDRLYE